MKIALIFSCGRTAVEMGNYCGAALKHLGHEVSPRMHVPDRGSWVLPKVVRPYSRHWQEFRFAAWLRRIRPELVVVIKGEDLNPNQVVTLRRETGVPWVNWWADDPGLFNVSRKLSPVYDLFLTNDPACVEAHRTAGASRVDWLTFAHDPDTHRPGGAVHSREGHYRYEIVFAGRLTPHRVDMLTPLVPFGLSLWSEPKIGWVEDQKVRMRELPSGHPLWSALRGGFVWGKELAAIYGESKICVNVHSHGEYDANLRVFETTACGPLLITEDRPLVRELFQVGAPRAEIAVYSGEEDLVRQVRYFLNHDEERAAIAARGMARCRREHTYEARMKRLLELAQLNERA